MKKHLPVLFIAGQEDPVGPYGKGVEQAAKAFRSAGMVNVSLTKEELLKMNAQLNKIRKAKN